MPPSTLHGSAPLMFGIGIPELILIAVVALIVVGPKDLPVTLRAIGRAIREFQRASRELRKEAGFDEVVDEVTRPLREGLAGIEADVLRESEDTRDEYPDGGPDDYDALPESAKVYPELSADAPRELPEGTVSRKASAAAHDDPIIAAKLKARGISGMSHDEIVAAKLAAPQGVSPFAKTFENPSGDDPIVAAKLDAARSREAAIQAKLAALAPAPAAAAMAELTPEAEPTEPPTQPRIQDFFARGGCSVPLCYVTRGPRRGGSKTVGALDY